MGMKLSQKVIAMNKSTNIRLNAGYVPFGKKIQPPIWTSGYNALLKVGLQKKFEPH